MNTIDLHFLDNYTVFAIGAYIAFAWYSIRWEDKNPRMKKGD